MISRIAFARLVSLATQPQHTVAMCITTAVPISQ